MVCTVDMEKTKYFSRERKRVKDQNLRKFTLTTRYFRHKAFNGFNRNILELSVLPEHGRLKLLS